MVLSTSVLVKEESALDVSDARSARTPGSVMVCK
jgi:hypothetical protein